MKKILVSACSTCPYKYVEVKDFQPPFPSVVYSCSLVGEMQLRMPSVIIKEFLPPKFLPDWCPLEDE